ncbi:MAG: hypothetical protein R6V14_05885 [Halanaerobiales bacterium]
MNKIGKKLFIVFSIFLLLTLTAGIVFTEDTTENITFSGEGDDILEIENPGNKNYFLMKVIGNKQERHFAVTGYDENNDRIDTYINTTDFYEGLRPVNEKTKILEINASGEWEIILKPIKEITIVEVPGNIEGSGDYVFKLKENVMKAEIIGNDNERHFAILVYDENFNKLDLAVNTTDKYEGTVMIPKNAVFIEVIASGNWNISF